MTKIEFAFEKAVNFLEKQQITQDNNSLTSRIFFWDNKFEDKINAYELAALALENPSTFFELSREEIQRICLSYFPFVGKMREQL